GDHYRLYSSPTRRSSDLLAEVLERLADYTEERQALVQKVMLAFIYPAIVTVIAFGVISLLLIYVVPQVTRVFENTGQALPTVTRDRKSTRLNSSHQIISY